MIIADPKIPPLISSSFDVRIITRFDITLHEELSGQPVWARVGAYLFPRIVSVPLIDEVGNPAADTILIGPLDGGP